MDRPSNANELRPGDIVLIPYSPYPDHISFKTRPALVVSSIEFNRTSSTVILVPISSNIEYHAPYEIILERNNPHFNETNLRCSSAIMCGSIFAFSKVRIIRKKRLGVLHPDIYNQVKELIGGYLQFRAGTPDSNNMKQNSTS